MMLGNVRLWVAGGLLLAATGLAQAQKISVKLQLSDCQQAPKLYSFNGFSFDELQTAQAGTEAGTYVLTLSKSDPGFYYVGAEAKSVRPVILGSENNVVVKGSCANARSATVEGSGLNTQYEGLKVKMNNFRQRLSQQLMTYRNAQNKEQVDQVMAEMRQLDTERTNFLDSLKKANPLFSRIAALNTYLSFFNNNNGRYTDELQYFASEYFRFANFSEESFNNLPWVYEAFLAYTQTLSSVGLPDEMHREYLEKALSQTPAGSKTRQLAYAGVIAAMEQRNHANLAHFAKSYLGEYASSAPPDVKQRLQGVVAMAGAFSVGGEAPDFTQETPDGQQLSLSQLRGNVVLVDFWASWCGPCRRENPNVVKMYNKYKEKGFEILGVSLDEDRDRWLKAIEADGLTWRHVSDLKGWRNQVAQTYSVRSIPHTILLDKDGKIIARNLRGEALERKLEEIFN